MGFIPESKRYPRCPTCGQRAHPLQLRHLESREPVQPDKANAMSHSQLKRIRLKHWPRSYLGLVAGTDYEETNKDD